MLLKRVKVQRIKSSCLFDWSAICICPAMNTYRSKQTISEFFSSLSSRFDDRASQSFNLSCWWINERLIAWLDYLEMWNTHNCRVEYTWTLFGCSSYTNTLFVWKIKHIFWTWFFYIIKHCFSHTALPESLESLVFTEIANQNSRLYKSVWNPLHSNP